MKIVWLTDLHLDFLTLEEVKKFIQSIKDQRPDALFITGDIGTAKNINEYLWRLDYTIEKPIYFVLGNHDFYGGSISGIKLFDNSRMHVCHYLTKCYPFYFDDIKNPFALIGHDGWADGRFGNYYESDVILNDYIQIKEFTDEHKNMNVLDLDQFKINNLYIMQKLADKTVKHFRQIPSILTKVDHVIVLTHVPPFKEVCLFNGKIANDDYLPHFSSKIVGDYLKKIMKDHPNKRMTVYCGHTHHQAHVHILDNLEIFVGGATYSKPEFHVLTY